MKIATDGSGFLCGEQSKAVSVYRNITLLPLRNVCPLLTVSISAGLDSPAFLLPLQQFLSVFLFLLPAAQVIVQVGIFPVIVREIPYPIGVFRCDGLRCPDACPVIVEQAVDAFILPQCVNGFLYIGGGVEYDVILPVKVGQDKDAMPCVCVGLTTIAGI